MKTLIFVLLVFITMMVKAQERPKASYAIQNKYTKLWAVETGCSPDWKIYYYFGWRTDYDSHRHKIIKVNEDLALPGMEFTYPDSITAIHAWLKYQVKRDSIWVIEDISDSIKKVQHNYH